MKWIRVIRDAWLIIGITILLFLVLEFIGFMVSIIYRPLDLRASTPVYKDFEQRVEFWVEHEKARVEGNLVYVPYHLWSRPPFLGKWTNIDTNGDRLTCYNADGNISGVKKIFMFGGSTLWGTGAPDWETIPSYLAKFLNENNSRCIVYNYGETGFVASQGLNRLITEIKKGNVPQLVIFYTGINDSSAGAVCLSALKTPCYHTFMEQFEKVFKKSKSTSFLEILKTTYTYRAIDFFKKRLFSDQEERWKRIVKEEDREEAICKTARYWLSNYNITSAIGKEYGFKVILVLQPSLYSGKKILQDYEKAMLKGSQPTVNATYKEIRKTVKEGDFAGIYDLSNIFEEISEPIYIDWAHIGRLGNYYVANEIAKIIKEENLLNDYRD